MAPGASFGRRIGLAKRMRARQLASYLSSFTHFSQDEALAILNIFRRFTTDNQFRLDRMRFRTLFHTLFMITDDIMLDLLFRAFDKNSDGNCDEEEFIKGLSTLLRGNLEEQTQLAYDIYDMNGDGSLAREELFHCLHGCIQDGYGIPTDELEDAEKEIVEISMRKLDYNRDGQITFDDFKHAVRRDPLLLTAIGACFPSAPGMATFLCLVADDYRGYSELHMPPKKHYARKSSSASGQIHVNKRNMSQLPRPSFMAPSTGGSAQSLQSQISGGPGPRRTGGAKSRTKTTVKPGKSTNGRPTTAPNASKGSDSSPAKGRSTVNPRTIVKSGTKSTHERPTTSPAAAASNGRKTKVSA